MLVFYQPDLFRLALPILAVLAQLSCPYCLIMAVLSRPGWPVFAVMFCPSYSLFPVLAVLFRLSSLAVLFWLSCPSTLVPSSPVPTVLSSLSCPGRLVLSVLSRLTCADCVNVDVVVDKRRWSCSGRSNWSCGERTRSFSSPRDCRQVSLPCAVVVVRWATARYTYRSTDLQSY